MDKATCGVPECGKPVKARDLCRRHYLKWWKYGDPLTDRRRTRRFCELDQCGDPVHGHGWCFKHYQRWRAHGDPQWQPPTYAACVVDGCENKPRSSTASMCEAHYCRHWRNGTLDVGQCNTCQEPMPPGTTRVRKYCDPCRVARNRAHSREQEHRRRAAIALTQGERINSLEIYERDGWKCGLCHRKVNPELSWPHPQSASLDHIVPIVEGGYHIRTNVHLAHLRCNLSKGDRGGNEQLMLIG